MRWAAVFLAFGMGPFGGTLAGEAKPAAKKAQRRVTKALSLDAFTRQALSAGSQGRVAGPIAELLGVPIDVPTWDVKISSGQANDQRSHGFMVVVEDSADSEVAVGLVFWQDRDWPGNSETYWLRASLEGQLERAVLIAGKRDAEGKAVRGSGSATEKDVASAEMKELFQHELDLWLRKAHLKKEWRSAAFSDGALKKKVTPSSR